MIKYTDTEVVFREFPDEITLAINISNCPIHCKGCHSPELWDDIGEKLTYTRLDELIDNSPGITCIGFMGGDSDPKYINGLAFYIYMNHSKLKVGWYSGKDTFSKDIEPEWFNYIKTGPYIEELGGLDSPTTNQKLFKKERVSLESGEITYEWIDITNKFWNHG